jgi:hypothetical protein
MTTTFVESGEAVTQALEALRALESLPGASPIYMTDTTREHPMSCLFSQLLIGWEAASVDISAAQEARSAHDQY